MNSNVPQPPSNPRPQASRLRSTTTFCIKTIHRPNCCAALIRSIYEHCGNDRPLIHVLDDGRPDLRFSSVCPDGAALADKVIETEYDIGLSAGRNRLLESTSTPMVIFTDDDHFVGPQTQLAELVRKLQSSQLDLLAGLSKKPNRQHADGTPRLLKSGGGELRIPLGQYRRVGDIAECAFVSNCFVAYRDILQAIRWDEDLKVEEHWDFFWRAKIAGVKVGVALDHVFPHVHVDPPGYVRRRPQYLKAALQKHRLERVTWR
jgi:hypothetical protein